MARVEKGLHLNRRGCWTFRIYLNKSKAGPRRQVTLPFGTSKEKANRIFAAEKAMAAGRAGKHVTRPFTFEELANPYQEDLETRGRARSTIEAVDSLFRVHLIPYFGKKPIEDIAAAEVEKWMAARVTHGEKPAAPATINLGWNHLKAFVRRAVALGWLEKNPWPVGAIKPRKTAGGRTDYFTRAEWDRFRRAVDLSPVKTEAYFRKVGGTPHAPTPREYRARVEKSIDVFTVQLYTASRSGEIIGMVWGDVDLAAGSIGIRMPKTGKTKTIPLMAEVRAPIERQSRGLPAAPVFTMPDGKPWTAGELYRTFRTLRRLAGLPARYTTHTLRHTAASWMAEAGLPDSAIRHALGHSSVAMTARYSHVNLDGLRVAFGALESIRDQQSATPQRPQQPYLAETKD
jgi:integrase